MKVRIKLGKVKKFGIGWCIPHKMAADRVKHDKVHTKLKQSQLLLTFFSFRLTTYSYIRYNITFFISGT